MGGKVRVYRRSGCSAGAVPEPDGLTPPPCDIFSAGLAGVTACLAFRHIREFLAFLLAVGAHLRILMCGNRGGAQPPDGRGFPARKPSGRQTRYGILAGSGPVGRPLSRGRSRDGDRSDDRVADDQPPGVCRSDAADGNAVSRRSAHFDRHIVNFEARRGLHRSTEKAVRPVPTVPCDEMACTDLRSHRGRSRPGIRDHDIARFELLRRGEPCGSQQGAGKRDVGEL